MIDPNLDNSLPESWQASYVIPGGTPGFENSSAPEDVLGCTDDSACNFNGEANVDDGSCEYALENFDCDGNCIVEVDCFGECGGDAVVDECGECGGDGIVDGTCDCEGNVDLGCGCGEPAAEENFDCDGNCIVEVDCFGECGGDAVVDECGECGGDGAIYECGCEEIADNACDCDGNIVDECGECGGSGASFECWDGDVVCDGSECSEEPVQGFELTIETTGVSQLIIFQSSISGLEDGDQLGIFDAQGILNSGDCASDFGELLVGPISSGTWNGTQLNLTAIGSINNCAFGGFQLPGYVDGNPVIVKVFRESEIYDTNLTFSAGTGTYGDLFMAISEIEVLSGSDILGCTDDIACNYDSEATLNDGSCEYALENFDCDGNCIVEVDCFGECGGDTIVDECGECDGDGSSCAVYIESSLSTSVNEADLEDLEVFEENFELLIESQLGLPDGSVEIISVTILRDIEVIVEYSITLTDEELAESEFVDEGSIQDALDVVESDIEESGATFVEGCTDDIACNYDSEATLNDGSCEYALENFDCDGNCLVEIDCSGECAGDAVVDECGECNGPGAIYECGCEEVADDACDCDGNAFDECGECGGDNSQCTGCVDEQALNYDDEAIVECDDCCLYPEDVGCTDLEACNFGDFTIACDDCCDYGNEYFLDTDGDGLGYGLGDIYCEEDAPEGWVLNDEDSYPNCSSNEVDACDICDGDNSSCSGCTDSEAFNYDADALVDNGSCIYIPLDFVYSQSTQQGFYFVLSSLIDGESLVEGEDWIGAFSGDTCVGSIPWSGEYTTIPAMGDDGSDYSDGYLQVNEMPSFVIYDGSEDSYYPAEPSEDIPWENNLFATLDFINVYPDCNNDLGGSAFVDDCGICAEGLTGHIANSDDIGCGCFAEFPQVYYFDVDSDGLGNGGDGEALYCSYLSDTLTNNTEYTLPLDGWVLDGSDACPYDSENDADSDGLCGDVDGCPYDSENDADSDGLCGDVDGCPYDSENDADSDGLCGDVDGCPYDSENDADSDGLCGDVDECPYDSENDADSDGLCGDVDECPYDSENDADSDGLCGDVDGCPYDSENDADSDGLCGDVDTCPYDSENDADGDDICGDVDTCPYDSENDADGDDICGDVDEYPNCAANFYDCNEDCGGSAFIDDCGVCSEGLTDHPENSDIDCDGVCFGEAFENECGCVEGTTGLEEGFCLGCTDSNAWNCPECPDAHNGNPNATVDDGSCIYAPEEWSFNQSTLQAFYFIADADIDGSPISDGDWIGVFNGDVCAGFWPWEGPYTAIPAMGDDGEDYSEGYFSLGDFPEFRIYDGEIGQSFGAMPSENISWVNNGLSTLDFLSGFSSVTYTIDLNFGANLVSFPALPEDNSIGNIMQSIEETVDGVIGEGVAANLLPNGQWVGSLDNISATSGYWVKQTTSDELNVTGLPYDSGLVFDLHFGANLISYPFLGSAAIDETLPENAYEYLTGIIGEGVAATLLPNGSWAGSLDALQGKEGYWFISSGAFDFSYIPPIGTARTNFAELPDVPFEFDYAQSTKQAFYFVSEIEGASIGDWLLAYSGDNVVGARMWNGDLVDIPAMGQDDQLSTAGYCMPEDIVKFKLFKSNTGELIDLTGSYDGWSDLSITFIESLSYDSSSMVEGFGLSSIYPNPFNPSTTIEFYAEIESSVNVSVYDLNGRLVDRIMDSSISAGSHSVTWDASSFSSGIYIVQVQFDGSVHSSKIMLVK